MDPDPQPDPLALGEADFEWTADLAAMLRSLPDAVMAIDAGGAITFANLEAERLFGYGPGELAGEPVQRLWPERFHARYLRNVRRRFERGGSRRSSTESWGRRQDGSEFLGELRWRLVATEHGPQLLSIGRDVTRRAASEIRLRALVSLAERALAGDGGEALATQTVELVLASLPVSGVSISRAGGVELARAGWVEDAAEPILRLPLGAGATLALATERELAEEELSLVRGLGATLTMALERLRDEERVRHDALHDPLTGVANRLLLADRLGHALDGRRRSAGRAGVLFVDLDRFKRVNDDHGHAIGDAVLVELARRVSSSVRPGDTVARYGGDEFVAVCEDVDVASARVVAERILAAVSEPIATAAGALSVSASIGVAVGGGSGEQLLERADSAAYRAKTAGRGRVVMHDDTNA